MCSCIDGEITHNKISRTVYTVRMERPWNGILKILLLLFSYTKIKVRARLVLVYEYCIKLKNVNYKYIILMQKKVFVGCESK